MAFQPFIPLAGAPAMSPHHPNCSPLQRHDSALHEWSRDVVLRYFHGHANPQAVNFNLECAGCCTAYLVHQRQYTVQLTVRGERVEFVPAGEHPADQNDFTYVFVRDSQSHNSANAQLATLPNADLGVPGPLVAQGGKGFTYQIYGGGADGELSMGLPGQVRLERIALNHVTNNRITVVRVCLADAAIQELYREKLNDGTHSASLRGQVYVIQRPEESTCSSSLPKKKENKDDEDDETKDLEKIEEMVAKIKLQAKLEAEAAQSPKKSKGRKSGAPASAK